MDEGNTRITTEVNRLRFELQRSKDLLSRAADKESNEGISRNFKDLQEQVERVRQRVLVSKNRLELIKSKIAKS